MIFDRTGACVAVPSQKATPRAAQLKIYPVVGRYRLIAAEQG